MTLGYLIIKIVWVTCKIFGHTWGRSLLLEAPTLQQGKYDLETVTVTPCPFRPWASGEPLLGAGLHFTQTLTGDSGFKERFHYSWMLVGWRHRPAIPTKDTAVRTANTAWGPALPRLNQPVHPSGEVLCQPSDIAPHSPLIVAHSTAGHNGSLPAAWAASSHLTPPVPQPLAGDQLPLSWCAPLMTSSNWCFEVLPFLKRLFS